MAEIGVWKVAPRESDMLFHPFAHLELTGYSKDDKGRILLSPSLATDSAVDSWTDHLNERLEKAREEAKRHIRTARGSAAWCADQER
jgi:hypothetical protein